MDDGMALVKGLEEVYPTSACAFSRAPDVLLSCSFCLDYNTHVFEFFVTILAAIESSSKGILSSIL